MTFVLDASIALAWFFEDESSTPADSVLGSLETETALVPSIWPLEIANAICSAERRGRLQPTDSARFRDLLDTLPVDVMEIPVTEATGPVLGLARTHQLSACDAAYLWLAMREALALATLDTRLRLAATRIGVPVLGGDSTAD